MKDVFMWTVCVLYNLSFLVNVALMFVNWRNLRESRALLELLRRREGGYPPPRETMVDTP